MPSLSEEAHAQNKSNFHPDLTIIQSRLPFPNSNNDSDKHKIREKHDKLLDPGSNTGRSDDVTVPENNVELLKKMVQKSHI